MHKMYLEAIGKQLDVIKKYDTQEYKRQEIYLKYLNRQLGIAIMLTPYMNPKSIKINSKEFKI